MTLHRSVFNPFSTLGARPKTNRLRFGNHPVTPAPVITPEKPVTAPPTPRPPLPLLVPAPPRPMNPLTEPDTTAEPGDVPAPAPSIPEKPSFPACLYLA